MKYLCFNHFSANGTDYILDFATMEEYPESDISDKVKVVRRDLVKGTLALIKNEMPSQLAQWIEHRIPGVICMALFLHDIVSNHHCPSLLIQKLFRISSHRSFAD